MNFFEDRSAESMEHFSHPRPEPPSCGIPAGRWKRALLWGLAALVVWLGEGPVAAQAEDEKASWVAGTVVSSQGRPLAGVVVDLTAVADPHRRALELRRGRVVPPAVARAKTDARGTFRLVVPEAGLYQVIVGGEGWVDMRSQPLALAGDRLLPPVALERDVGTTVRVDDPAGRPVAGAHVRALGLEEARRLKRDDLWQVAPRTAVTDASGSVRLSRAADERLGLWAIAAGFWERTGEVAGGAGRSAARLALEPGVARRIEVRDHAGRAVAGLVVGVGPTAWPLAVTDAAGRATVTGPRRGRVPLSLIHPAGWRVPEVLPAMIEGGASEVALELPAVASFRGTVRSIDGRPLPEALVWPAALPGLARRSDGRGEVQFRDLPLGSPFFRAAAKGALEASARVTLEAGRVARRTFSLPPEARLAGRVTSARGPTEGALVRLAGPGSPALEWHTAADGRFEIPNLDPEASFELLVSKEGFRSGRQRFSPLAERADREALAVVLGGERFGAGRVVDGRGRGVVGVRVTWRSGSGKGAPGEAQAMSDAEGRFELPDLPAGRITLHAEAVGFAPLALPGLEVAEGAGRIDLGTLVLEPEVVLRGRVEDGRGQVVTSARVTVAERTASAPLPEVQVDEGGRFRLAGLAAGERLNLTVEAPGFARLGERAVEVPTESELVLVLSAAATLTGYVTNDAGERVEGAEVWARLVDSGSLPTSFAAGGDASAVRVGPVMSDAAGRFELAGVPGGSVTLGAYARGYLRLEVSDLEVDPQAPPQELELVLERGAVVRGKVRSADGAGVAGARVFVDRGLDRARGDAAGVISDGEGRFELPGVPSGPVRLAARHARLGVARAALEVEGGEHSVDLVFEARGAIRGRVVDSAGVGVAGAEVVADSGEQRFRGRSDGQGAYHLPTVDDGEYRLTARLRGRAPAELEDLIEVVGAEVRAPDLEMSAGAAVVGTLVGVAEGAWQRVQVLARGPGTGNGKAGEVTFDGRYRIAPLAAGSYSVVAEIPGSGRQARGRVEIAPGDDEAVLDLEFDVGLSLGGRVVDGGRGLAGASLVLVGLDRPARTSTEAGAGGEFEISGIDPGVYRLEVVAPQGGAQTSRTVAMTSDKRLDIDLGSGVLAGEVLAADSGRGLADVALRFQPLGTDPSLDTGLSGPAGSSDSDGRFVLRGLAAGRYRLEALKFGYQTLVVEVAVEAGEVTDGLRLEMSRAVGR